MKTKNLFQTVILVLTFCVMNQFAIAQQQWCTCNGNKIFIVYPTYPIGLTKCVSQGELPHYLLHGWVRPACSALRLTGDEELDKSSAISIYPNPIYRSATISFSLSQSQNVSLKIFDVSGRLISTLADKIFDVGENELVWNSENINAGVYFLHMQTEENLYVNKLIVTK